MAQGSQGPYQYDPSLAAAIIFAVIFGLSTIFHAFQLIRWRTWYFIPFLVGGLFETIGYMVRAVSANQNPDYEKNPFITQTVLILLAPALYAASIYMLLGRIIRLLDAASYSLVPPKWLTKVFVAGDVVSFVLQGIGGGMQASAEDQETLDRAKPIVVGGLFVQLIVFGLFIIVVALFHRRIALRPTPRSERLTVPWKTYLFVLYAVSTLVMARSIFRVIEYIEGKEGELQSEEIYFYILDTLFMFCVSAIFNWYHPSQIVAPANNKEALPLAGSVSDRSVENV